MSDLPEPGVEPEPPARRRSTARTIALVLTAAVAVYLTLFVVLNGEQVPVDFVFFSAEASIALVIVLSLVLGIGVGYSLRELRDWRKRRRER